MFLLRKLKKWIKLEIKELEDCKKDWERKECINDANACQHEISALENVQYILENKRIWTKHRGHGIFK